MSCRIAIAERAGAFSDEGQEYVGLYFFFQLFGGGLFLEGAYLKRPISPKERKIKRRRVSFWEREILVSPPCDSPAKPA